LELAERFLVKASSYENAPVARSAACVPTGTQAVDLALGNIAKSKAEPLRGEGLGRCLLGGPVGPFVCTGKRGQTPFIRFP